MQVDIAKIVTAVIMASGLLVSSWTIFDYYYPTDNVYAYEDVELIRPDRQAVQQPQVAAAPTSCGADGKADCGCGR